ncbi:MAG: hypothetical protein ABI448_02725 [Bacteroidia bacterium]
MKKIFTLTVLFCLFNSCKKDYVCKCTDFSITPQASSSFTIHNTKENAKVQCEEETPTTGFTGCKLE